MPSLGSKVRAWDKVNANRAILNDLRWENVWRKSEAFAALNADEKLRWREHIANAPASMPLGRLLRYKEYLDAPPWSEHQLKHVQELKEGFWYKFGKVLHVVDGKGVHTTMPLLDDVLGPRLEWRDWAKAGAYNKNTLPDLTKRQRATKKKKDWLVYKKEQELRDILGGIKPLGKSTTLVPFPILVANSKASSVPHLAPNGNRSGLSGMRAGSSRVKERSRSFQSAVVWEKTNEKWEQREYKRMSLKEWQIIEKQKYELDEETAWFKENDLYDDSVLYLYQEAELTTLASRIGSRVHERLMATMIEGNRDVYAPLLPDDKVPERLRELVLDVQAVNEEKTGAGYILGYSDHTQPRQKEFYEGLLARLLALFKTATKAAVEYPVHHPNLCAWKSKKLILFETRLDAVLQLDDEYVVVEFKTIGGSKWSQDSPVKRISSTSLWDDALEQALIGAHLFHLNTTLTVSFLALVFIERKRTVQHIFKVKNNAVLGKNLVERLFKDKNIKDKKRTRCVYVDERGVYINKTRADSSVLEHLGQYEEKISMLNDILVPELRPSCDTVQRCTNWLWVGKQAPRDGIELQYLVGHSVIFEKDIHVVLAVDDTLEEPALIIRKLQGPKISAPLSKLGWSRDFLKRVKAVKYFYALHFLEVVSDAAFRDELIRERSALFEVVLLLEDEVADEFFFDGMLDVFKVARELFYDRSEDEFFLNGDKLKWKMKGSKDNFNVGIAPNRNPIDKKWDVLARTKKRQASVTPTDKIKQNLKKRMNISKKRIEIARFIDSNGLYNGWYSDMKRDKLFPKRTTEWQKYIQMLNMGYETISSNSVYPSGWYAATRYKLKKISRRAKLRETYKFEPLLPTSEPQRDERLPVQALTFPIFVKMFLHKDSNPELIKRLQTKDNANANDIEFDAPSSRVFRDGCVPSSACGDVENHVAAPRKSTTLQIPPERAELHLKLVHASESVPARISSDVPAMRNEISFEAACQAFEKTPDDCLKTVEPKQSLDVRAYRALNRRINRTIGNKYGEKEGIMHSSSRSMWKQRPLREALDMVDSTEVELVDYLLKWHKPVTESIDVAFDGFDF